MELLQLRQTLSLNFAKEVALVLLTSQAYYQKIMTSE